MNKFSYGNYDSSDNSLVFNNSYSDPGSETEIRKQLSYPLKEVRDYINKTVALRNDGTSNIVAQLRINNDNLLQYRTVEDGEWYATASGGHIIYDENDNEFTQRIKLKFIQTTVEDDEENGYTIVYGMKGDPGEQGPAGPQGAKGEKGEDGNNFVIRGRFVTYEALVAEYPEGYTGRERDGWAYAVGTAANSSIYIWDVENLVWSSIGKINTNVQMYPVGSVYINSVSDNPGTSLGGLWTLIDQEFTYNEFTGVQGCEQYFIPDESITLSYFTFRRNSNSFNFLVVFTCSNAIGDNTQNIGSFNLGNLGIGSTAYDRYFVGTSDEGDGIVMATLNQGGVLRTTDVITKSANGTIPANSTIMLNFDVPIKKSGRLDSACNRFYFVKTSDGDTPSSEYQWGNITGNIYNQDDLIEFVDDDNEPATNQEIDNIIYGG